MIAMILIGLGAFILGAVLASLPIVVRTLLQRRGLMVVRRENLEAAIGALNELNRNVELSGHLSTVSGRKPKVVRRLDRGLASMAVHLKACQRV